MYFSKVYYKLFVSSGQMGHMYHILS